LKDSPYFKQAQLMLKTIPHVAAESCFALKGGTAINLFVRDMPRLSVDIDLTYLPVDDPRDSALKKMSDALGRIANAIKKAIAGTSVQETRAHSPDRLTRLTVSMGPTRMKIEPNEVIRGAVYPVEERELTRRAEDLFELSVAAQTLSWPTSMEESFALRWTGNIHAISSMLSFSWIMKASRRRSAKPSSFI
jgi:Nucleotidyl transferase AbiEii toxin, Type IV TA system